MIHLQLNNSNFQAVCQSVVDKYTTGKREYLGFVLQTAEGGREDKAVIVTLEFRAVFMAFLVKLFQSEAFGRYERIPPFFLKEKERSEEHTSRKRNVPEGQ